MKKKYLKEILVLLLFKFMIFSIMPLHGQLSPEGINTSVNLIEEPENLDVFHQWLKWNKPGNILRDHLTKKAVTCYNNRSNEIAGLKSEADWQNRQKFVSEKLKELIGPFPEKTPLNPKITGVIKKEGYRIEKVVFESFPGFYVTGCIYIPEKIKSRVPAILNVIGHNQEAFRNELYQVINYNLVKKGIIVFAIDPPGQGEHVQNYDTTVKFSSVGYSVIEHCYFGNQVFLSGYSCAKYFIWDGIRAIDYLISRKEVDPERIGVTGFSGGGTITSYIGALDNRMKVSVPCSWANANKSLLETKGAQDAESIIYHSAVNGISFEDLLEVRAPKPTLLTFVSRDEYLSLQGAREACSEAGNAYKAFGNSENLVMVEDDSRHWLTPKIRLSIYSFFMKHFNLKGDPAEVEAEILPAKELTVTPTGQISTYLGGDMIFDVNRKITEKLIGDLEKSRENNEDHLNQVQFNAKMLSGFICPENNDVQPVINGKYQRQGYSVGKYAIEGEGDYAIPYLLFVPDDDPAKHPAIIYLHPEGKAAEAKKGGEIEKLVREGYIVAAVDVPGTGELKNTATRELSDGYTAILIGRSVVGIQAGDIIRIAKMLSRLERVNASEICAIGINEMCIPLIHAAAFDSTISNVVLDGPLVSYRSVAMNRNYRIGFTAREGGGYWHPYEIDFSWGVAGALTAYDLPDLLACIAPRKIVMAGIKDQMLEPATGVLINQDLGFPRSVYSIRKVPGNIKTVPGNESIASFVKWCFE